jgi:hypothetical protein
VLKRYDIQNNYNLHNETHHYVMLNVASFIYMPSVVMPSQGRISTVDLLVLTSLDQLLFRL